MTRRLAVLAVLASASIASGQGVFPPLDTSPAAVIGAPLPFRIRSPLPLAPYILDVSFAGSTPGMVLGPGGPVIPLNRPFLHLDFLLGTPAAALAEQFIGLTDGAGAATALLHLPDYQPLAGLGLHAAFICAGNGPSGIGFISNAPHVLLTGGTAGLPAGTAAPFVPPPPPGSATRYVAPSGSDGNNGLTPATAWRQVAYAATQLGPGDIVEVADGSYTGPVLIQNLAGTASQPVIFRAPGGNAVIVGAGTTNNTNRNSIFIGDSSHVTLWGFRAFASNRAGVRVSLSHHVTIAACVLGNHPKWGIFTDYADDLRLLGNTCYGSVEEHGIYHSNSGDRAVIAGNHCHGNAASGIQINADPAYLSPIGGYVPDGISRHCLVERNLLVDNGALGGAAINLASVRESVIRNNVIVDATTLNSTGIALWDDGNGPSWGSKDNLIEMNTVAFSAGMGRYALSLLNGSTGNRVRNNVLRGGRRGALAFVSDSLPGLAADGNLFSSVDGWPIIVRDESGAGWATFTLPAWQALGLDAASWHAAPVFVAEALGDFSLAPGSPGRNQGLDFAVQRDYQSSPRPAGGGPDMGAFER